ncbi:hypothetical protein AWJ20_3406 [Sugiyamaella lignohabitans]|uniref:DUF2264 domain-containing protein n=1 Tax=Sugiyamaella lignohabitans TaxID=796027 RepID=A0A167FVS7_9ASCO|nr:uncharacterized protein AWJ20_3406 [Sugiyamaella lignohabitans]ANB15762.1 hypothetical protein AWJ20_3406 [Sugiyamaella lignohabitans]
MTKSTFSPIGKNPFVTREDVQEAFVNVFEPLLPAFSEGGARVRVEESGAFCDFDSSDLEGFSRPLWGLVPFVAGGGKFDHWDLIHKGITNGTDPEHPEYWGETVDLEQRLVEFASIGFALAYIPEQFYEPLSEKAKENFKKYLVSASYKRYPTTNWKWFHVLLTLGLKKIGADYDQSITERNLEDMEEYYLKDGWYGDGPDKQAIDYYNPWAFHFYGLMYSKLYPEDTKRNAIYHERVKKFVNEFIHWFSDDGAALPFGRSLVYKWCCGSFWGALAFADQELLPWGVLKGLYLRHLRWWSKQPISRASSGLMSLGFSYPNAIVCERYNSPQSPYWGGKIFFPLALPADHPFWTAEELPIPRPQHKALPVPGMVFSHYPKNTVALVSGPYQNGSYVRFQGEKYCKFAYSTRYAFSVEVNDRNFVDATLDNMIAFSEDGDGYRFRTKTPVARIAGDILYSKWNPWKNVNVETWQIPAGKWHVRVHRILSDRDLITVEGGFAISAVEAAKDLTRVTDKNTAYVVNKEDFSGIVDLTGQREGITTTPEPSTNLYFPKTLVPQLKGTIKANTVTILACAVIAQPDVTLVDTEWKSVPKAPAEEELEHIIKTSLPVLTKE